eukprot:COSAG01_NODE_58833_length_303_cov_1.740196_1_plen_78_part_01
MGELNSHGWMMQGLLSSEKPLALGPWMMLPGAWCCCWWLVARLLAHWSTWGTFFEKALARPQHNTTTMRHVRWALRPY